MNARPFDHVTVLMGGASAERDVSLSSGAAVRQGLAAAGYTVEAVDVVSRELSLPAGTEAVFIALHGEFGEDGGVQTELARLGVPYAGAGPEGSRLAFDKAATKRALDAAGIPTPAYAIVRDGDACPLPFPVVVKPVRQGSSIGLFKVDDEAQWAPSLHASANFGDEILVEAYIEGRELTVGIVDGQVLPIVEIEAPDQWYDYQSKYTNGACRYRVPADLPADVAEACSAVSLQTFEVLACRGFGRVDFRLSADGSFYVLELNTIPGFTETSLLPKAAAAAGITFAELCDRIIRTARC